MRGIERVAAGALLVLAVTATAVLARTSAPGGGHAQAVPLQSPPRSHLVAPLPVVLAVPEAPPRLLVARPAKPPAPSFPATLAPARPVEVPSVAPAPPAPPAPPPAAPSAPPSAPPVAPVPAPAPASPARVVAAAQPQPAATKTFGHSHPRGHAWGHVKHAGMTTPPVDPSQASPDDQAPTVPAPAPPAAAPPVTQDQPPDNPGNGNGHGNAWGHSKH